MTMMVSCPAPPEHRVGDTRTVGQPTLSSACTLRRPCRSPSSRSTSTPSSTSGRASPSAGRRWRSRSSCSCASLRPGPSRAGPAFVPTTSSTSPSAQLPGAIVAGRIGYALLVPEAFAAGPTSLLDPAVGGLELGLAVVGGIATASIVALLLGSPVGRWAHVATIPLLTAIAVGKLTMVLGGSGQGRSSRETGRPPSSAQDRGSRWRRPSRPTRADLRGCRRR